MCTRSAGNLNFLRIQYEVLRIFAKADLKINGRYYTNDDSWRLRNRMFRAWVLQMRVSTGREVTE